MDYKNNSIRYHNMDSFWSQIRIWHSIVFVTYSSQIFLQVLSWCDIITIIVLDILYQLLKKKKTLYQITNEATFVLSQGLDWDISKIYVTLKYRLNDNINKISLFVWSNIYKIYQISILSMEKNLGFLLKKSCGLNLITWFVSAGRSLII